MFFASAALSEAVSGKVVMDIDLSNQTQGSDSRLWVPYPVTGSDQAISNIKIKGNFSESAIYTDSVYKTPFLYAKWDKDATERQLSFTWDVSRNDVSKKDALKKPLPRKKCPGTEMIMISI